MFCVPLFLQTFLKLGILFSKILFININNLRWWRINWIDTFVKALKKKKKKGWKLLHKTLQDEWMNVTCYGLHRCPLRSRRCMASLNPSPNIAFSYCWELSLFVDCQKKNKRNIDQFLQLRECLATMFDLKRRQAMCVVVMSPNAISDTKKTSCEIEHQLKKTQYGYSVAFSATTK